MSTLCLFEPGQVIQYWGELQRRLALTPDFFDYYDEQWVISQAAQGHLQVWTIGPDVMFMTQVSIFPKGKVLDILWAQGEGLEDYLEAGWETLQRFAVIQDCIRIRIIGRRGWMRKLRRFKEITTERVVLEAPVKWPKGH